MATEWVPTAFEGYATEPTGSIWYEVFNNIVTLRPALTAGTTNGAGPPSLGMLPAAIRPPASRYVLAPVTVETGAFGNQIAVYMAWITNDGWVRLLPEFLFEDGIYEFHRYIQDHLDDRDLNFADGAQFSYSL
jgi:hypothetical protein